MRKKKNGSSQTPVKKDFANSRFEFKDKKLLRAEEGWAESYAAPDWRKRGIELQ